MRICLPLGLALGSPIFPSGCEGKLGVALESLQGRRPSPSAGDLRELPRVPLRGEGRCGFGGASRDSTRFVAMEEGLISSGGTPGFARPPSPPHPCPQQGPHPQLSGQPSGKGSLVGSYPFPQVQALRSVTSHPSLGVSCFVCFHYL